MVDRYLKIVEPADNVATALRDLESGESVEIDTDASPTIDVGEDIPFGHKMAVSDIPEGETVYKYGKSIGYASQDISAGAWVHDHNVDSNYGRGDLADEETATAISE